MEREFDIDSWSISADGGGILVKGKLGKITFGEDTERFIRLGRDVYEFLDNHPNGKVLLVNECGGVLVNYYLPTQEAK